MTRALLLLALTACGPNVSEARLVAAPPRAKDCKLAFLKLEMKDVVPGAPWEIVGHVVVSDVGKKDPLSPELREEVRPRACEMGGEGVSIMMSALGQGTSVDYAVVRRHVDQPPSRPDRF